MSSENSGGLLNRIQDSLGQMTARERKLVLGTGALVLCMVVGGAIWFMSSTVHSLENRVADREESLRRVQLLALDHTANVEKAARIQEILEANRNSNMQSFVEKTAAKVGIQRDRLDAISEKQAKVEGDLEEKMYHVQASKLSLEDAANLLHELETADFPLEIRSARMKTSKVSGEKMIRLTLEIAAFRLINVAAGGE